MLLLLQKDTNCEFLWYKLGLQYFLSRDYASATKSCERAIDLNKHFPAFYLLLACIKSDRMIVGLSELDCSNHEKTVREIQNLMQIAKQCGINKKSFLYEKLTKSLELLGRENLLAASS